MPKTAVRPVEVEEDEDDFRRRAQINQREKKDNGLFKLPEGPTTFRILKTPGDKQKGSPSVWMEYYVHRNVGPKKWGPYRCGLSIVDDSGDCWLCKVADKLKESGKSLAAAEIERKKAYAIQVAVWDENLGDLRGPLLWSMTAGKTSKALSYKIESIIAAPASKRYVDHADGYNFTIDRTGTGMTDTTYTAPERSEERSAVPAGILKKLKPFVEVIQPYDKDVQKKAYYGETEEESVEEAPEPRAKKRPVIEEDESDSLDSSPEVDDDQDDPPPTSKKKVVVEAEETDEDDLNFGDDDLDDAGDDQDDEPVRPAKKAAKKR